MKIKNSKAKLREWYAKWQKTRDNATTPEAREQYYFDLQQLHHDQAPQITLSQSSNFRFEQRWVNDWFYRIGQSNINEGGYFYAYDLDDGID